MIHFHSIICFSYLWYNLTVYGVLCTVMSKADQNQLHKSTGKSETNSSTYRLSEC